MARGGAIFDCEAEGETDRSRSTLGGPKMLPAGGSLCDFSALFFEHFVGDSNKKTDLDDMVWFVRERGQMDGTATTPPASPTASEANDDNSVIYILRRTAHDDFPPLRCPTVDWRATLYLNIITQWSYELTVGVCRSHVDGRRDLVALSWVTRRVYAQPSSPDPLDKNGRHQYTFPNVFFTVDDFEEAFGGIVLEEGHGWCVQLTANSGGRTIPVFRGAVPHQKMIKMFNATAKGILPVFKSKDEIISMKGPGGRGSAKASVSLDDKKEGSGKRMKCALVNVSASWFDIAYALESPISPEWLHLPSDEELKEELRLNAELKIAIKKSQQLNRLAKEDEKGGSALHRASQKAKEARNSASRFFDDVKGGFLARANDVLNRDSNGSKQNDDSSDSAWPNSPGSDEVINESSGKRLHTVFPDDETTITTETHEDPARKFPES